MPLKLNKPVKSGNAGAAAARAPGQGQGQGRTPFMPPPPPRATRPNARTRNPFDVTPADVAPSADLGASIPPYTGNSAKSGMITTGFDGLAMPPVRQTDVFSQMPATPSAFAAGLAGGFIEDHDDIFSRGNKPAPGSAKASEAKAEAPADAAPQDAAAPDEVSETIENAGPAPAPSAAHDDHDAAHAPSPADAVWADDAPEATDDEQPVGATAAEPTRPARGLPTPPAFPGTEPAPPPAPKRKRRWFGLRFLLLMMLLLGGAAAGGIYGFVKKQTEVQGLLRFQNVAGLKTIEQQNLLAEQRKLINSSQLRDAARVTLLQQNPAITPGFLDQIVVYDRFANTADWAKKETGAESQSTEAQPGTFAVTYNGNDPAGDDKRVRAVILAMYDFNAQQAAKAAKKRAGGKTVVEDLTVLRNDHQKAQQRVNDLRAEIERLNVVAQKKPDAKELETLNCPGRAARQGLHRRAAQGQGHQRRPRAHASGHARSSAARRHGADAGRRG
jgi:uncharacterized small protein (DUF1192 family)